jgi:hypothetical protein
MPPERIEKIESEKSSPHPDEVIAMADGYKMPNLCNHYCANECPIGRQYVPEVKVRDLSQIVLEMVASLNAMNKKQERLLRLLAMAQSMKKRLRTLYIFKRNLRKYQLQ